MLSVHFKRFIDSNNRLSRLIKRKTISNDATQSIIDTGAQTLFSIKTIESLLRSPQTAPVDKLINELKTLHSINIIVPLTYYLDISNILSKRRDGIRLELLIQIARENLHNSLLAKKPVNSSQSTLQPIDKLISFSINGLLRYGAADDALKLWIRMHSSGYVTTRVGLEKAIDKAAGGWSAPSDDFVEKMQVGLKKNLWHQNPNYYFRILKLYRQQIRYKCETVDSIAQKIEQINDLWVEALFTLRTHKTNDGYFLGNDKCEFIPLDLFSIRVQCFSCAVSKTQEIRNKNPSEPNNGEEFKFSNLAEDAFKDYLTAINRKEDIFQDIYGDKLSISAQLSKKIEKISENNGIKPINDLTINNEKLKGKRQKPGDFTLSKPLGQVRTGLSELLDSMVSEGLFDSAVSLLDSFLFSNGLIKENENNLEMTSSSEDMKKSSRFIDLMNQSSSEKKPKKISEIMNLLDQTSYGYESKTNLLNSLKDKNTAKESFLGFAKSSIETSREISQSYRTISGFLLSPEKNNETQWLQQLIGQLISKNNCIKNIDPLSTNKTNEINSLLHQATEKIINLAKKYKIPINEDFHANRIKAISSNLKYQQEMNSQLIGIKKEFLIEFSEFEPTRKSQEGFEMNENWFNWEIGLNMAYGIVDSLDEKMRNNGKINHALIQLLCEPVNKYSTQLKNDHKSSISVIKGLEILQNLIELKTKFRSKTQANVEILPDSLILLLEAATKYLNNSDLRKILTFVEDSLLNEETGKFRFSNDEELNQTSRRVLEARIMAYARLHEGFNALSLLQELRILGGSVNSGGGRIGITTYRWVLQSLYSSNPKSQNEKSISKKPEIIVNYFITEMGKDGHKLTPEITPLLLQIFTKSLQINKKQTNSVEIIEKMKEFIGKLEKGQIPYHPRIKPTEYMLKEVIKAYLQSGLDTEAFQLITEAKSKYNITVSGLSYEPLVFQHSVLRTGSSDISKDILSHMAANGANPTPAIVDAIAFGMIMNNETEDCILMIQDVFNQYQTRPTVTCLIQILEYVLEVEQDVWRGRQLVRLISQMFNNQERLTLVGPSTESYKSHWANPQSHGVQKAEFRNSDGLVNMRKIKEMRELGEFKGKMLRLNVPLGMGEKGVLMEKSLEKRFKLHGLNLYPEN